MTYEEARVLLEATATNLLGDSCSVEDERKRKLMLKKYDAIDIAIKALEKQIPKKPIWERLGDSLSNADIITMCPCCHKGIEEDEHHCECGQLINWSK